MILKKICWVLMILNKTLDFDDFGACCWILMILKKVLDFDDFEEGAKY